MKWHPFAEKFPLMTGQEWEAFKEDIKASKGNTEPILYRLVKGKREGIDGRTRFRACEDLGLKPRMRCIKCPDDDVLPMIIRHNIRRRHMDADMRKAMVEELRALGQSTRTIAETIGTSPATVKRDMNAGGSNEPPATNGTVKGKDGKTYSATKPTIFCRDCRIHGPKKGCLKCAEVRGQREKKDQTKKPKAGEVVFSIKAFNECLARAAAELNKIAHSAGLKTEGRKGMAATVTETPEMKRIRGVLQDVKEMTEKWVAKLKKG